MFSVLTFCSVLKPILQHCGSFCRQLWGKNLGAPSQSAKVEIFASLLTLFATPTHLYLYIYFRPNVVDNGLLDLLRVIRFRPVSMCIFNDKVSVSCISVLVYFSICISPCPSICISELACFPVFIPSSWKPCQQTGAHLSPGFSRRAMASYFVLCIIVVCFVFSALYLCSFCYFAFLQCRAVFVYSHIVYITCESICLVVFSLLLGPVLESPRSLQVDFFGCPEPAKTRNLR